jgi:ABC-2 type transport system ATP-binding protein
MAGQARAIVQVGTATDRRVAGDLGLTVEPTSIQQLVVALSRAAQAASTPTPSTHLEEAFR